MTVYIDSGNNDVRSDEWPECTVRTSFNIILGLHVPGFLYAQPLVSLLPFRASEAVICEDEIQFYHGELAERGLGSPPWADAKWKKDASQFIGTVCD